MARKEITWFSENHAGVGAFGPAFRVGVESYPVSVWLYATGAPLREVTEVDILADGVSIFGDEKPTLVPGQTEELTATFNPGSKYGTATTYFDEGTVLTCELSGPTAGSEAKNLTVQLSVEELED